MNRETAMAPCSHIAFTVPGITRSRSKASLFNLFWLHAGVTHHQGIILQLLDRQETLAGVRDNHTTSDKWRTQELKLE